MYSALPRIKFTTDQRRSLQPLNHVHIGISSQTKAEDNPHQLCIDASRWGCCLLLSSARLLLPPELPYPVTIEFRFQLSQVLNSFKLAQHRFVHTWVLERGLGPAGASPVLGRLGGLQA